VLIRPARPETDFEHIVAIISADQPTPITVGQLQAWHSNMPPGRICLRLVAATDDAEVVGYGVVAHETWSPPGHFYLWVIVAPEHRGQGTGEALYRAAFEFAEAQGATRMASEVRDDCTVGLEFAKRRGFRVARHSFELGLDLYDFDDGPYGGIIEALESSGITFASLADYGDSEDARRRLYTVNLATIKDIPGSDGTWMSFPEFVQTICGADWYRADGQIVAIDGDSWIGLSAVQLMPQRGEAYTLMTGVLPNYRGRKLGLALKVLAIRYAKTHGAHLLRTDNDSNNAPMLAINRRLGFRPLPGKYILERVEAASSKGEAAPG
jgi:ribosomal protein S18 acetylase RimI-like enzyme